MLYCINNIVLLSDVFHIGLVIGPRPAVLACSLGQYGKNQSNIFRIGPIPVNPITARSESARRFDNRKEKSREILD
jgi:hypothetical protein